MRTGFLLLSIAAAIALAGGCRDASNETPTPVADADGGSVPPPDNDWDAAPPINPDVLAGLPTGIKQWEILCARGSHDRVAEAFCAGSLGKAETSLPHAPPVVTSLLDLQTLLGLTFVPYNNNQGVGNPGFALLAHSTSLTARMTSSINPRAFIFTPPLSIGGTTLEPNPEYVVMAFGRGEQFVELASKDPTANGGRGDVNFYLFRFQQACNASSGGCTNADLFTPTVESGFTSYTLYQDLDVANTVMDCLECHQPAGPGTPRMLRMESLLPPWTHWFSRELPGSRVLLAQYEAAHGTQESYGGVPGPAIGNSYPGALEGFVENNGGTNEPNAFQTVAIENEVEASNPNQPEVNVPPGVSATWRAQYALSQAGQFIPVPYHDTQTTDPTHLAAMTQAYAAVVGGTMPPSKLPDISQVFLASALPDMTMLPAPGQTGEQILVQMCSQCHNGRLDQTISRALFNAMNLGAMSTSIKNEAIRRIHLPRDDAHHMPPVRFRDLSDADLTVVTQALEK